MSARTSLPDLAAAKWHAARSVENPFSRPNGSPARTMASIAKQVAIAWSGLGISTCRSMTAP